MKLRQSLKRAGNYNKKKTSKRRASEYLAQIGLHVENRQTNARNSCSILQLCHANHPLSPPIVMLCTDVMKYNKNNNKKKTSWQNMVEQYPCSSFPHHQIQKTIWQTKSWLHPLSMAAQSNAPCMLNWWRHQKLQEQYAISSCKRPIWMNMCTLHETRGILKGKFTTSGMAQFHSWWGCQTVCSLLKFYPSWIKLEKRKFLSKGT